MKEFSVSIIVPIHNSETTLKDVFDSIEKQDYPIEEITLLDNNSSDSSYDLMSKYADISKFYVKNIKHTKDCGLSYSYNEAIRLAKTSYVITLQSDCVILDKDGVKRLIEPLTKDEKIVASCAMQITPWSVWQEYNFWQKSLFSRHAGKVLSGRNGRFCCFSVEALNKIGLFNEEVYRTAGEDGELFFRLSKIGKVIDVDIVVEHVHSRSGSFSIKNYIYKENQLAEAVGACFSRNLTKVPLTAFLRIIFVLGLFIPKVNIFFAILIFLYGIWYTKDVIIKERKNHRIIVLPFVNIFLIFGYVFYFSKGFITKRQRL